MGWFGLKKFRASGKAVRSAIVLRWIPAAKTDKQNQVQLFRRVRVLIPDGLFVPVPLGPQPFHQFFYTAFSSTMTVSIKGVPPFENNWPPLLDAVMAATAQSLATWRIESINISCWFMLASLFYLNPPLALGVERVIVLCVNPQRSRERGPGRCLRQISLRAAARGYKRDSRFFGMVSFVSQRLHRIDSRRPVGGD